MNGTDTSHIKNCETRLSGNLKKIPGSDLKPKRIKNQCMFVNMYGVFRIEEVPCDLWVESNQ